MCVNVVIIILIIVHTILSMILFFLILLWELPIIRTLLFVNYRQKFRFFQKLYTIKI